MPIFKRSVMHLGFLSRIFKARDKPTDNPIAKEANLGGCCCPITKEHIRTDLLQKLRECLAPETRDKAQKVLLRRMPDCMVEQLYKNTIFFLYKPQILLKEYHKFFYYTLFFNCPTSPGKA